MLREAAGAGEGSQPPGLSSASPLLWGRAARGRGGVVLPHRLGQQARRGEIPGQANRAPIPSRWPQTSTRQPDTPHPSSQGPGGQSLGLGFPICAVGVAGLVWGWGGGLGKGLARATSPQCVEWIEHRYQESCSSTHPHLSTPHSPGLRLSSLKL